MTEKTEGNLVEAYQLLLLISFQSKNHFDVSEIKNFLLDFMIYDVFDLVDSIICQNKTRAMKIIDQLLSQKRMDPLLILWALVRELRILIYIISHCHTDTIQKVFC